MLEQNVLSKIWFMEGLLRAKLTGHGHPSKIGRNGLNGCVRSALKRPSINPQFYKKWAINHISFNMGIIWAKNCLIHLNQFLTGVK